MRLYLRLPHKSLGRYCQLLSKLSVQKVYRKRGGGGVQTERVVYRKKGGSNLLHTTVPDNLIKGSEMQIYKSFSRKNPNKNYLIISLNTHPLYNSQKEKTEATVRVVDKSATMQ